MQMLDIGVYYWMLSFARRPNAIAALAVGIVYLILWNCG
jgi:hypothetical protein